MEISKCHPEIYKRLTIYMGYDIVNALLIELFGRKK